MNSRQITGDLSTSDSNSHTPLLTRLSHVLVAYTIEFDNEFERQMPHRTTNYGATSGAPHAPWLVSLAMYVNCMQHVGEKGLTVAELERLARTKTNLDGMRRWGYVVFEPNPPRATSLIRPTPAGRKAQEIWQPLFSLIETRWRRRFGSDFIDALRASLLAFVTQLDPGLPDCMPILNYGLFSAEPDQERAVAEDSIADLPLSALLARLLVVYAWEFERESPLSLAISANVLRVLDEQGVLVRDLPLLSGVSKEAISIATAYLQKHGAVVIESASAPARGKVVYLTPSGCQAQTAYHQRFHSIEEGWQERFGKQALLTLEGLLSRLDDAPDGHLSLLFDGLEPYPDGWRASVGRPQRLPDFPMVLHRGGFPDGS